MDATSIKKLRERAAERAHAARRQVLVLLPLLAVVLLAYLYRNELFGLDRPVRLASVVAFVILGWALARSVGRVTGPFLYRRLAPSTAGIVDFLIRLATLSLVVLLALYAAGLPPQTLWVGGAVAVAILGLAAQQTLGNLIAGLVILSARPFRLGDRILLRGGNIVDQVEGVVSALGLLYTTLTPTRQNIEMPRPMLAQEEGSIMVPNSLVLGSAVVPGGDPPVVSVVVRLRRGVTAAEVQSRLDEDVSVPVRSEPEISFEVVEDEVSARILARPQTRADGPRLTDEILAALDELSRGGRAEVGEERSAADAEGWEPG
jgi:small-conductance mechanosensitive channel